MSRQVRVLTQDLSGDFQFKLNGNQFTFTEDMLTKLSALASAVTLSEDGNIQFTTTELSAK